MSEGQDVEARLNTHEAVCAERYLGINAQLRRLEGWFVRTVAAVLGLLVAIVGAMALLLMGKGGV